MKIGVEVEGVYNVDTVGRIEGGGYGYGNGARFNIVESPRTQPVNNAPSPSTYGLRFMDLFGRDKPKGRDNISRIHWFAQSDSSIHATPTNRFSNYNTIELVSSPVEGRKKFKKVLEEFKILLTDGKKLELRDVICFNSTCGCHIHLSFKDFDINKVCGYAPLIRMRRMFFRKLAELDIRDDLKEKIKGHYFRSHSQKLRKEKWKNRTQYNSGPRNMEFNFHSFASNKGFEWRAFNLYGVETWKEFFKVLMLGYDCGEYLRKALSKFRDTNDVDYNKQVKDIKNRKITKTGALLRLRKTNATVHYEMVIPKKVKNIMSRQEAEWVAGGEIELDRLPKFRHKLSTPTPNDEPAWMEYTREQGLLDERGHIREPGTGIGHTLGGN